MKSLKRYSELVKLPTFAERLAYLKLDSKIGIQTFGADRWLNQDLYRSKLWKSIRDQVILRDSNGDDILDLGCQDMPIRGERIHVHHMNPVTVDMLEHNDPLAFDPEFLIVASFSTHNCIHYGSPVRYTSDYKPRTPFDTCPWRL